MPTRCRLPLTGLLVVLVICTLWLIAEAAAVRGAPGDHPTRPRPPVGARPGGYPYLDRG